MSTQAVDVDENLERWIERIYLFVLGLGFAFVILHLALVPMLSVLDGVVSVPYDRIASVLVLVAGVGGYSVVRARAFLAAAT